MSFKSKKKLTGADRLGVQASDLIKAMTDAFEGIEQQPRVDKPRVLIETMRMISADDLTAKDAAFYEMLLAHARDSGIEKQEHELSGEQIAEFTQVKNFDRLNSSLKRLISARVEYDFHDDEIRRHGEVALIGSYELSTRLLSNSTTLTYSIPAAVRRVWGASRDFAMLDINAYPKFKSKYTSRLYPRLALRAGYDAEFRGPWSVDPEQLAKEIDFNSYVDDSGNKAFKEFKYGIFRRDVLLPVVEDINGHVRGFKVSFDEIRTTGRGRSVAQIVFNFRDVREQPLKAQKASRISAVAMNLMRTPYDKHSIDEIPGSLIVGQAVAATGLSDVELIQGWKATLDRAKADHTADLGGMEAGSLLWILKKKGVAAAFETWVGSVASNVPHIETTRLPVPVPAPEHTETSVTDTVSRSKEERTRQSMIEAADRLLVFITEECPIQKRKIHVPDDAYRMHLDPECAPWASLQKFVAEDDFKKIARALHKCQRLVEIDRPKVRLNLRNLADDVKAWNLKHLVQTAWAIVNKGDEPIAPARRPSAPQFVRAKNFTATREVSEISVEGDWGDPAFDLQIQNHFDDRNYEDLEDVPF